MATVTSLTAEKIYELLSDVTVVSNNQDEIKALLENIKAQLANNSAAINLFNNQTLPDLLQQLADGSITVNELLNTHFPNIQQQLNQTQTTVNDLNLVKVPSLQNDLNSGLTNIILKPQTFFQDEPPENTEERDLQLNDVWYDTNDSNKQYRWNGTSWVNFEVNIPEFSLVVTKFRSSTHLLY